MKKITILALVFSLGLSSCGIFDFGPVPPPTDYPYQLLAYDMDDELLCTPMPEYLGYPLIGMVDGGINSAANVVVIPNVEGVIAKVKIITTIPYWTVLEANGDVGVPVGHQRPDLDEEGNFTNVITVKDGDDVLFTVTSPKQVKHIFDFPIEIPKFSGEVIITRVAKDFTGTVRFYVAGNDIWNRWTNCVWTGFEVEFE